MRDEFEGQPIDAGSPANNPSRTSAAGGSIPAASQSEFREALRRRYGSCRRTRRLRRATIRARRRRRRSPGARRRAPWLSRSKRSSSRRSSEKSTRADARAISRARASSRSGPSSSPRIGPRLTVAVPGADDEGERDGETSVVAALMQIPGQRRIGIAPDQSRCCNRGRNAEQGTECGFAASRDSEIGR